MRHAVLPSIAGVVVAGTVVGYRRFTRQSAQTAALARVETVERVDLRGAPVEDAVRALPEIERHAAGLAGAVEALPKMQRRLKSVERSASELAAIRKRL